MPVTIPGINNIGGTRRNMRTRIFQYLTAISVLVVILAAQLPAQIVGPRIGKLPGRFQPFDPSEELKNFSPFQQPDHSSTGTNSPFKLHDGTRDLKHQQLDLSVPNLSTIPYWSDHFDYHGLRYTYKMVGTDPKRGSATTVIPTILIPIRWVFADGLILDASTDIIDGQTPVQGIINSPLFQDYDFVIGGTHVGNTQYGDAFQRSNFWNWVSTRSPNYHVRLGQPTIAPVQTINVPADKVQYFTNPDTGEVFPDIDFDFVYSLDRGLIEGQNVSPATLPIIVWGKPGAGNALGYHGAYQTGNSIQTYMDTAYLPSTAPFGVPGYLADVATFSHEVIEWMDDPFVDNHSAGWNNPFFLIDFPPPVRARCDSYFEGHDLLETADPFEDLLGLEHTRVVTNGFVYHIAEGAFIDFYTRSDRSRSVNGQYSFFEIGRPYGLETPPSAPCVSSLHPDLTFFAVPGSPFTWPYGLNNTGSVAGYYGDTSGAAHGFVKNGSGYFTVDYPGAAETILTDINDGGTIVGVYYGTDGYPHGFSLRNGRFAKFDFPGSTDTIPEKINSIGDIVGEYDATQPVTHGFFIHNGQYSVIDTPYGLQSEAAGINDVGIIAGNSWTEVSGPQSGFIKKAKGFSKFDFPDANITTLTSINVNGDLSGYSIDPFGGFGEGIVTLYGYPYYLEGQFTYIYFVGDINGQRQIVGQGYDFTTNRFGAFIGQLPVANNGN
jgi:hypothetical protein